ncbi:MAG: YpmA family protein [Deltaproteobacteria bacterium]
MSEQKGKLELIAARTFPASPELIQVVDFLNKSLKEKAVMFGLTKDKEKNEMTLTIYDIE